MPRLLPDLAAGAALPNGVIGSHLDRPVGYPPVADAQHPGSFQGQAVGSREALFLVFGLLHLQFIQSLIHVAGRFFRADQALVIVDALHIQRKIVNMDMLSHLDLHAASQRYSSKYNLSS